MAADATEQVDCRLYYTVHKHILIQCLLCSSIRLTGAIMINSTSLSSVVDINLGPNLSTLENSPNRYE